MKNIFIYFVSLMVGILIWAGAVNIVEASVKSVQWIMFWGFLTGELIGVLIFLIFLKKLK